MADVNRRFSSEEVSAIVQRALQRQNQSGDVSYEDLEEIARQSGISQHELQLAIDEEAKLGELERAKETWRQRHRSAFYKHLRAYGIVNVFLLLINLFTSPRALWFVFPVLGWGIGLAFHAAEALFPSEAKVEHGARRLLRRRERREAKRANESNAR